MRRITIRDDRGQPTTLCGIEDLPESLPAAVRHPVRMAGRHRLHTPTVLVAFFLAVLVTFAIKSALGKGGMHVARDALISIAAVVVTLGAGMLVHWRLSIRRWGAMARQACLDAAICPPWPTHAPTHWPEPRPKTTARTMAAQCAPSAAPPGVSHDRPRKSP